MYITQQNEALKKMIQEAIEQRDAQQIEGEDISILTAQYLVATLLQNEQFQETLFPHMLITASST